MTFKKAKTRKDAVGLHFCCPRVEKNATGPGLRGAAASSRIASFAFVGVGSVATTREVLAASRKLDAVCLHAGERREDGRPQLFAADATSELRPSRPTGKLHGRCFLPSGS